MNGRRKYKNRIISYAAQIKRFENLFETEMSKSADVRDEALLLECLETLEFLHERIRMLDEMQRSEGHIYPTAPRTRAAIAACVAIAVLLISGVAQALGFRVWSALIHWDAGYLNVNYVPESQGELNISEGGIISTPYMDNGEENAFDQYPTPEDALEALGITAMLPTNLPEEMALKRIIGDVSALRKSLIIDYASDNHMLHYETNAYSETETAALVVLPGDESSYKTYESNGVTYLLSTVDDGTTYATWMDGNTVYSIATDLAYDKVFDFIDSIKIYE